MPGRFHSVLLYDVREPLSPVELGRYRSGTRQYGQGYPHDAFAYQGRLYINQYREEYQVVDVTDPAAPRSLGTYTYNGLNRATSHANAVGTFAGRTIAFEGGESVGAHLRVLDVTDPAHILKIGQVRMRTQTSIHNMVLVDERLYVAWYAEGVRVFDVSHPTRPRQVAHFNTYREKDPDRGNSLYEGALGMRVPGDGYVYVVESSRGLLVFREP